MSPTQITWADVKFGGNDGRSWMIIDLPQSSDPSFHWELCKTSGFPTRRGRYLSTRLVQFSPWVSLKAKKIPLLRSVISDIHRRQIAVEPVVRFQRVHTEAH